MPPVAERDDSTFESVGISLALENTRSDGADEVGIAKYFLASLEILGMRNVTTLRRIAPSSLLFKTTQII